MKIALLGSTGSIGTNTLKICEQFGIDVEVLVAGNNIELLKKQVNAFHPKIVVTAKPCDIEAPVVLRGEEGIIEAIERSDSELVVNALVGFLGLRPTLKAIELGKRVALANKESLVVAGKFIDTSKITPIDSEHFGLWYLLQNSFKPKRLILTASGGAFRDWKIEKIASATLQDALKHPNWSMGTKITIDSATMANKLFEVLEAYWLFGCDNIDGVIEPSSIVHGIVEFIDGSTTFHASIPDMKLPIAYALGISNQPILESVDIFKIKTAFEPIDQKRYPIWQIKEQLLKRPELGVVVNAANEAAIEQFIEGKKAFGFIAEAVLRSMDKFFDVQTENIDAIFTIDSEVRNYVQTL
ncbi:MULTISPECIES: 1-deoxy-D-xylulose-5-phosphate reductoisomerase [unclassified Nitratiruptor]|uniref:1-deoxy-D-xylulose-5-phosphate reductoisomerase n=1 Tax=unclassified Nitratiruptor TaxID=2624044 RepID=UPI001916498D|nr:MULTISPECIES: 1-deoxy-D-xylulose-5-phosphate reductoisomerase [unclassified Nitratiruptor]BCD60967.1 1-deoxy-D-xylulose-5-phosphate reductoisomerase [Nitratiruptor sp. YY08-10]BCD64899.1 1-deoxy-D-xylulose-5-phosphate reductoisomerase [Nitratiruptor sp. YY08-14]